MAISRVTAVQDGTNPWQLAWTRAQGEQRLACTTYQATPSVNFKHNAMFVFAWTGRDAEPRWLGTRLSRPYVDAAHADLHGDGQWRMVAVEVAADGGHSLGVYRPIGFGYEGEWRGETVPGLERVAAFGALVLCWGHDANGAPRAWQLRPTPDGYRLLPLSLAPPALEMVAPIDATRLGGWWNGGWQIITLPSP